MKQFWGKELKGNIGSMSNMQRDIKQEMKEPKINIKMTWST